MLRGLTLLRNLNHREKVSEFFIGWVPGAQATLPLAPYTPLGGLTPLAFPLLTLYSLSPSYPCSQPLSPNQMPALLSSQVSNSYFLTLFHNCFLVQLPHQTTTSWRVRNVFYLFYILRANSSVWNIVMGAP